MRRRLSLSYFVGVFFLWLLVLVFPLVAHHKHPNAQSTQVVSYTKQEFVQKIAPTAVELGKAYGVRPSFIIAEASLESQFGQTLLAAKYYNLFGSLAQSGDAVVVLSTGAANSSQTQRYHRYSDWKQSLYDYMEQVKAGRVGTSKSYQTMVANKNTKTLVKLLAEEGFSSSKTYAKDMVNIVDTCDLTRYD
ncbi:glucosaminidase domain-containing protein [Streptococcus sp. HF-1907]|uniref:glucosaminidase domain-containing protein n=1 Tax=Streptococcus sp. HF-1907 TaxID=2785793 RepID=UPI0018A06A1E|nr:glucosaminidase domain-containing protein [Streptococcus sp. HF-1907]MBF7094926.1 glucosaminidase domain-containing protein [Streptococcus sp. HF-1907]